MRHLSQRLAAVTATAGVVAAGALAAGVLAATPAYAGGPPELFDAVSDHNADPIKTVTVVCPAGHVFGAGARIIGGGSGVALTAMVPNQSVTSVTVAAQARAGHPGEWSVVAYAVCKIADIPPFRTVASADHATTVTATCPDPTRVAGTGFRVAGPGDHTYLDEVAPDQPLRQVRVHASGSPPASLTAYAICKEPTIGPGGRRLDATSDAGTGWPKTVTVAAPDRDRLVYGAGATVRGPEAFLTALVPDPERNLVRVTAARAGQPAASLRAVADVDAEESLTGYAVLLATFH